MKTILKYLSGLTNAKRNFNRLINMSIGIKKIYCYRKLIMFSIPLLISLNSYSQGSGYLELNGFVLEQNRYLRNDLREVYSFLNGADIELFCNGKKVKQTISEKGGKFILKLELNKEYTLEVSKADYIKKTFEFNTMLPSNANNNRIYHYKFSVSLFNNNEEIDLSILDEEPVGKFSYSDRYKGFLFDYAQAIKVNKEVVKQEDIVNNKRNVIYKNEKEELRKERQLLKEERNENAFNNN